MPGCMILRFSGATAMRMCHDATRFPAFELNLDGRSSGAWAQNKLRQGRLSRLGRLAGQLGRLKIRRHVDPCRLSSDKRSTIHHLLTSKFGLLLSHQRKLLQTCIPFAIMDQRKEEVTRRPLYGKRTMSSSTEVAILMTLSVRPARRHPHDIVAKI
jgi:hypothetical protein